MLRNYLTTAYRNLIREKGTAVINVLGLAVGLACCLVVAVLLREELSVDRFHEKAGRTYRITTTAQVGGNDVEVVAPDLLGPTLVEDLPGVEQQVRIRCMDDMLLVQRRTDRFNEAGLCFADPSLFQVFDFTLARGDETTVLSRPHEIVLSQELAERYFGDDDPIGESLILNGEASHVITGVLDESAGRSHLRFGIIASFSWLTMRDPTVETWADGGANPYVVLDPRYGADEFASHVDDVLAAYAGSFGGSLRARVQALPDVYLSDGATHHADLRGSTAYFYLFSSIALLILIIACINFVNLATARALRRAREVGVRKAIGATRSQLTSQFLVESLLLSVVALLIALTLAWLALPSFGATVDRTLEPSLLLDARLLLVFVAAAALVGVAAGSYPAIVLSAFDPNAVIKARSSSSRRTAHLRRGLVVAQFTAGIALAAGTMVFRNQLDYMRSERLGFDKEHVVILTPTEEIAARYAAFKREVIGVPGVTDVTTAPMPGHTHVMVTTHGVEGYDHETHGLPGVPTFEVDHDFLDLLGIRLIAGRNFEASRTTDAGSVVLVNEAAVREFGWGSPEEALGKWVIRPDASGRATFHVAGVVEDFLTWTMREGVRPIFLYLTTDEVGRFGKVLVKLRPDDVSGTLSRLEAVWAGFAPDRAFEYAFLDQEVDRFYQADVRQGRLLGILAGLALFVACLGLFGLAAFTVAQRAKEIGVRKVLGASVPTVVGLLCREYVLLVGVAFAVAMPVVYAGMQRWLAQFAYSAGVGWATFVLTGIGALVIALLAVGYQSMRAAMTNPAEVLRTE